MEAPAFGVSLAPKLFQMRIHQLLEGLPDVYVIADDILVAGEGPTIAVAEQDHNQKLHALLNQCRRLGSSSTRQILLAATDSGIYGTPAHE